MLSQCLAPCKCAGRARKGQGQAHDTRPIVAAPGSVPAALGASRACLMQASLSEPPALAPSRSWSATSRRVTMRRIEHNASATCDRINIRKK